MKRYFVNYYNDFTNTYNLAWAETPEQLEIAQADGWEQITRKKAQALCMEERRRQLNDPSFSGYADTLIFPIDYDRMENDWQNDSNIRSDGYILEYKQQKYERLVIK